MQRIMLLLSTADLVFAATVIGKYSCQHEFVYERVFGTGPCPGPETH